MKERRGRGFRPASTLLESRIRKAGESRGFAVTRLLTRWAEIVGPEIAAMARPAKLSYGRGFGATLTLVCGGAAAPLVQSQAPRIVEKVNACYGYAAVSRIRVTQTAPEGFAEPQATYTPPPRRDPELDRRAAETAAEVADPELRAALQALARNILSRNA